VPRHDGRVEDIVVFATPTIETQHFTLAAVAWPDEGDRFDGHVLIRTRSGNQWTGWREVHDHGHGPDPRPLSRPRVAAPTLSSRTMPMPSRCGSRRRTANYPTGLKSTWSTRVPHPSMRRRTH
jgi:hypothetical protein